MAQLGVEPDENESWRQIELSHEETTVLKGMSDGDTFEMISFMTGLSEAKVKFTLDS